VSVKPNQTEVYVGNYFLINSFYAAESA